MKYTKYRKLKRIYKKRYYKKRTGGFKNYNKSNDYFKAKLPTTYSG